MKFRFSIGRKIGAGFGVLIVLTIIAFIFTNIILKDSRKKTNQVTTIYTPSVTLLKDLHLLMVKSQMLITSWVEIQSTDDDKSKDELRTILKKDYPKLKDSLKSYETKWSNTNTRKSLDSIFVKIDSLFSLDKVIMNQLKSLASYEDASVVFFLRPQVDNDGIITNDSKAILDRLQTLIATEQGDAATVTSQMLDSFSLLDRIVRLLGTALLIGGIIIAFFTVRSIIKPVKQLKEMLLTMARGVLPTVKTKESADEIGEMSAAMNNLVEGLNRTTEFANEVGRGNFTSHYEPLSGDDALGHALLKMRTDLYENEQVLERKVIERTEEVVRQKQEIEVKNGELEILYKHVTDSIRYAKRIQESILPPESVMRRLLPESFVLYKPKDIVSGDFYWVTEKDDKVLFSAVDCTGHGVPGAFMSLVGYNLLKEISESMEEIQPAKVLDLLSAGVRKTLHQVDQSSAAKDGMDIALCVLDKKKMELQYSGAMNPLYLARNHNIQEIKADKVLIGYSYNDDQKNYTNHTVKLQKGDCIYIFSDGYASQFGGPRGKKFMVNNFRNYLLEIHQKPMDVQRDLLEERFNAWKGSLDQLDDICVMGVRI